jgi:hypothetical protein
MNDSNESEAARQLGDTRSLYEEVSVIVSQCADDECLLISPVEDEGGYEVEYVGKDSAWRTVICVENEPDKYKIVVASFFPISIPLAMRSQLAELIARINFDKDETEATYMAMNMDDGELAILTSLPLMDGVLTRSMLEKMLSSNLMVIEGYTSAIMKVVYCGVTPLDAMKAICEDKLAEKTLH